MLNEKIFALRRCEWDLHKVIVDVRLIESRFIDSYKQIKEKKKKHNIITRDIIHKYKWYRIRLRQEYDWIYS